MNENIDQIEQSNEPGEDRAPMGSGVAVRPIMMIESGAWTNEPDREVTKVMHRRFHTQRVLGEGGMAVVKEVYDANLLRSAAVKMVRQDTCDTPQARQGLVEEAQITAQLDHPNIVPVYDLGEKDDQTPYFAMKLVQGRMLSQILEEQDCRERKESELYAQLQIFLKVCDAIAFAHSRGVIHRDLKPHNVMVGDFGQVYVIDWGISGLKGDSYQPLETRPTVEQASFIRSSQCRYKTPIGTLGYMSPEQAGGDIDLLDERTDIFGLGGILYEILTGTPPYLVDDNAESSELSIMIFEVVDIMTRGHVDSPYERTKAYLPPKLCHIAMKAMRKAPVDRFQSVSELKTEVERFVQNGEHHQQALAEYQKTKQRLEQAVSKLKRSKEELHQANERLEMLATTDLLTGLYNRRRGIEMLESEMCRVARGQQSLSLVMIDLDHFKQINDTFGHNAGDAVLKEVARRLENGCRPSDRVVRWGGEELLVICPHTDSNQAFALAERLCQVLAGCPVALPSSQLVTISASMGTASTDVFAGASGAELIERADEALYEAKGSGRNCVRSSTLPEPMASGMG